MAITPLFAQHLPRNKQSISSSCSMTKQHQIKPGERTPLNTSEGAFIVAFSLGFVQSTLVFVSAAYLPVTDRFAEASPLPQPAWDSLNFDRQRSSAFHQKRRFTPLSPARYPVPPPVPRYPRAAVPPPSGPETGPGAGENRAAHPQTPDLGFLFRCYSDPINWPWLELQTRSGGLEPG